MRIDESIIGIIITVIFILLLYKHHYKQERKYHASSIDYELISNPFRIVEQICTVNKLKYYE